jgi:carbon starvation protein
VMCGAVSGFHALISSGTTPKMIDRESNIRMVGYGAMVLEGVVAVTALVAACALEPGDYFAINADPVKVAVAIPKMQQEHGWDLAPKELGALEKGTEEKLVGRVGGAVTLAVGMAKVFSNLPGMKTLMSYWYHFVIMFEALFILTLLESGTRVARFVFQEALTEYRKKKLDDGSESVNLAVPSEATPVQRKPNWTMNIVISALVSLLWGYLLYRGDLETLWRMLGIVNQLLASMALAVGITYILLHAPKRIYALCAAIPFAFLVVTVFWGSILSVSSWWIEIGNLKKAIVDNVLPHEQLALYPKKVFLLYMVCGLACAILILVAVVVADSIRRWWSILFRPAESKKMN